jgi:cardiolipin synthase
MSAGAADFWAALLSEPFWIAHFAGFLLVALHCLRYPREPSATVLWVFAAWSFPFFGPLLYLFFGVNRVPLKGWRKQRSDQEFLNERRLSEESEMPLNYWRAVHEFGTVEPSNAFERDHNRAMESILPDYPLLGGNSIRPLVTGDEAYPAMADAIRGAQQHIHMQTFILGNDATGVMFLDLLAERARAGVCVRLLYDHFGSTRAWLRGLFRRYRGVPNLQIEGWTQANPIKRQFQVNLRNHRKVLILDGHAAFMGGLNLDDVNVSRPGRPADRDYHFSVRGPIVQELQYSFLRDWYFMTDEDPQTLLRKECFPHIEPAGRALVRVVNGGPTSEVENITDVFFSTIGAARRQLLVVTPYLVPTPDLVRALRAAALRGVDVRAVVPGRNNHVYAGMASRAIYEDLMGAGVRIFERHGPFLHGKALLADDAVAVVGTANLDVRSLRLNYETNLVVYDESFIGELKRVVLEDQSLSEEISLVQWRKRPIRQRMLENFCHLMAPML